MQGIFRANPELAYGMLNMLLDISDPQLKVNVSSVLNNFLIKSEETGRVIERPAIDWVLEQIKNQNRPTEWLEILSQWGAKTRNSAFYLKEQLSVSYSAQQQEDILQALARANTMSYPILSKYSPEEIESFARSLRPFLHNESESLRFAALETLNAFSAEDSLATLANLASDESERIRIKAMEIAVDRKRVNREIKTLILNKISNSELRAVEREFAYNLAKRMLLNKTEYEQLYQFEKQSLASIREQARTQMKEIRLYRSYYYEF